MCVDRSAIYKSFVFRDFNRAFSFMTSAALYAERHQHHPEWSNIFNRVDITLSSHDAGGVTQKDIDFARWIEVYLQST